VTVTFDHNFWSYEGDFETNKQTNKKSIILMFYNGVLVHCFLFVYSFSFQYSRSQLLIIVF